MTELELLPFPVRNTSRLFFNVYPYKIRLTNPHEILYPTAGWDGVENLTKYTSRTRRAAEHYYEQVENFLAPIAAWLIEHDMVDRSYFRGSRYFTFYFEALDDFNKFISVFKDDICEAYQPADGFSSEQLETNMDVTRLFRDKLYFGSFNWKVLFDKDCDADHLDEWVEDIFAGDETRFYYDETNKQRSLYLTSEMDVALTKMSRAQDIYEIEQII